MRQSPCLCAPTTSVLRGGGRATHSCFLGMASPPLANQSAPPHPQSLWPIRSPAVTCCSMSLVVFPLRGSPASAELGEFMLPIILSQVVPAICGLGQRFVSSRSLFCWAGGGGLAEANRTKQTMSVLCLWSALYAFKSISSEPGDLTVRFRPARTTQ